MTSEEAARILDPDTSAEALAEIEACGGLCGEKAKLEAVNAACEIAAAALRAQAETEKAEPLTLKQLCEMDGEPVWVKPLGVWGLVDVALKLVVTRKGDLDLNLYGGTGRLYRRKPKMNLDGGGEE